MGKIVRIEVPVEAETAEALKDERRLRAVGELIDRIVRPTREDDPLGLLFQAAGAKAREAGLTDAEIDAELEAHRAEAP